MKRESKGKKKERKGEGRRTRGWNKDGEEKEEKGE